MKNKKIVVVGANAAGLSAAVSIKKSQPEFEVVVYEKTNNISYGRCSLFYYLNNKIPREKLFLYTPELFYKSRNIRVYTNTYVQNVNLKNHKIELLQNFKIKSLKYDKLILATGAKINNPEILNEHENEVLKLRSIEDADKIKKVIPFSKKILIIGGGYIGLKLSEIFCEFGKEVIIVDQKNIASDFCEPIQKILKNMCSAKKIKFFDNTSIKQIYKSNDIFYIETDKGLLKVDKIVNCTGTVPEKIFTGPTNRKGYLTNRNFEVYEDVYACGDCVEYINDITGQFCLSQLATTANRSGRYVGEIIGLNNSKKSFRVIGSQMSEFFNIPYARTGLTESECIRYYKNKYDKVSINAFNKNKMFGGELSYYNLLYETKTLKILGVEVFNGDINKIDIVSALIKKRGTAEDLYFTDFAYQPLNSTVWNPLQILAEKTLKK